MGTKRTFWNVDTPRGESFVKMETDLNDRATGQECQLPSEPGRNRQGMEIPLDLLEGVHPCNTLV